MEDLDIIEERAGHRVRLEIDRDAERPYDDGACPILQISTDYYGNGPANAFNQQADEFVKAYDVFDRTFGGRQAAEIFERYLRIFHGTKSFATYHLRRSNEYGYIAFDTKKWLEEIGVTDQNPDIEPVDRAEPCLDEVKAWATGEVYGWIVEKKVTWQRLGSDGEPVFLEDPISMETWEEVDSCWGFYGREYAEQAAKEALKDATEDLG